MAQPRERPTASCHFSTSVRRAASLICGSNTRSTQRAAATAAAPRAAPPAPPAPVATELNALGLIWTVIKGWFAGLFGGKRT